MWGKNPQVDGNGGNALIGPSNAVRLGLDLLTDLIEIRELLPFAVQELSPLCRVTMAWDTQTHTHVSRSGPEALSDVEMWLHLCWS